MVLIADTMADSLVMAFGAEGTGHSSALLMKLQALIET